jgi:HAD superfamily hydrolase (TIGR01509 family)
VPVAGNIELVCFDLGRVLVRICDDWLHACAVAGVRPPSAGPDPAARARLHDLVCRVEVGNFDHEAFCREAGPVLGLSPRDVSSIWDAYTRGPYPGAVELLDDLRALGVRTACLSNTNHNHWRLMGDPASHTYFPFDRLNHTFASHLVRLRKPDPAIYAHVEQTIGVGGEAIVFFDDLPENVAAAAARGWNAYRVDPASDNPVPQTRKWLADQGVLR